MSEMHGKPTKDGNRHCDEHGPHGLLYPCPAYDEAILNKIALDDGSFRANVNDPDWIQKQLDKGVPLEAILIFQVLAGPPR